MRNKLQIIIKHGKVIDGTGAQPYYADVGIKNGLIVKIGSIQDSAEQIIDARGLLVTPGFVDIHTHYDGQAVWDQQLSPSSWHGVTTVLMGNCGVGFAPVKKQDQQAVIDLMEGVEDIPGACLHQGLKWNWETFEDYLNVLDETNRDVDICTQLPHGPLRVFVMGERALRLEAATDQDMKRMREIARNAMHAGALGFSTSRTIAHQTSKGNPTPMMRAHEDELTAIMMGLADAGHGQLEYVSDWDQPDPATEFAMLERVINASKRTCVFTNNQRHGERSFVWRELLELSESSCRQGLQIRPIAAPRPIGSLFGLTGTQNPFSATPTYHQMAHLPLAERVELMRQPQIRSQILSEDPYKQSRFPLFKLMGSEKMYERMFLLSDPPNYEPDAQSSVASIAKQQGRSPQEVAYEMLISDEGHNFLYAIFTSFNEFNLEPVKAMLQSPHGMIGLSDGGAHVGFITDASFTTWLLSYWGRDRKQGIFPVEELVRRYTSDPAQTIGLMDRGVIQVGKKADINVIDFDQLAVEMPYAVDDLPAGGRRLLQKAQGYRTTLVSGVVTYRDGQFTGATPGRLVRGPQT